MGNILYLLEHVIFSYNLIIIALFTKRLIHLSAFRGWACNHAIVIST